MKVNRCPGGSGKLADRGEKGGKEGGFDTGTRYLLAWKGG